MPRARIIDGMTRPITLRWPVCGVLGLLVAAGAYSCTDVSITTVEVGRIQVTPSQATLIPGGTIRLDADLTDSEGRPLLNRSIEWSSTKPEVVTVDFRGLLTAVGPGDATVVASSEGVTGSAVVTVGRPRADLSVTTVGTPDPVRAGEKVTYEILVRNAGPSTATNVVVTESPASGLTFDSADPTRGSYDASLARWNVGSLVDGASATLTLVFRVPLAAEDPIRNSVAVTSAADDPAAANNVHSLVVAVTPLRCWKPVLFLPPLCPR